MNVIRRSRFPSNYLGIFLLMPGQEGHCRHELVGQSRLFVLEPQPNAKGNLSAIGKCLCGKLEPMPHLIVNKLLSRANFSPRPFCPA